MYERHAGALKSRAASKSERQLYLVQRAATSDVKMVTCANHFIPQENADMQISLTGIDSSRIL
jgi:hypothetical protein